MSEEKPVNNIGRCSIKRTRKTITLETKLEVLKRLDAGERAVNVARTLGLPATTVRSIASAADKIHALAESVTPLSATKICRARTSIMENMEILLIAWIVDSIKQDVPVSMVAIQTKAKHLFDAMKEISGDEFQNETFSASHGWFERFKKRWNLHDVKKSEMTGNESLVGCYYLLPEPLQEGYKFHTQLCSSGTEEIAHYWEKIHNFAKEISFQDVDKDDVELLESIGEELSDEDLVQMELAEKEKTIDTFSSRTLTIKRLLKAFQLIEEALLIFTDDDPNRDRSTLVCRTISANYYCYTEIFQQRKRQVIQQTLEKYLKAVSGYKPVVQEHQSLELLENLNEVEEVEGELDSKPAIASQ